MIEIDHKTDSCGTPFISADQELKDLLVFVLCKQLEMYVWINSKTSFENSQAFNFAISSLWLIKSNWFLAFYQKNKINSCQRHKLMKTKLHSARKFHQTFEQYTSGARVKLDCRKMQNSNWNIIIKLNFSS